MITIKQLGMTIVLATSLSAPALAFTPQSTVIAGNGDMAFADGVAANASFVRPVALAYAQNGDLYIVDQGAQRIRVLGSDRVVRTLAGGGAIGVGRAVAGSFRDGAVQQARFNDPSAILVDRDGALLVADTGNRCIRRIMRGVVTTFAGDPARGGRVDGAPAAARFAAPMGISTDGKTGYYVADYGNGLRHISSDGTVTSINVPNVSPTIRSVTAVQTGQLTSVLIAGERQLFMFHPEQGYAAAQVQDDNSGEPIGDATDVVAIGPHEFLYADPARHAVRYFVYRDDANGPFNRHYAFPLTGATPENAANTGGALIPGSSVPFVTPVAVALAPNGSVTVADAGNRRVRSLAMVDRRSFASGDIGELQLSDEYYRIAYVSNSTAFRNATFEDSMGGWIERVLNRDSERIGLKKPVRVEIFKLQTGLTATSSYVQELLGDGLVDEIVWGFNAGFLAREVEQYPISGPLTPDKWQAPYAAIVADMSKKLAAKNIGLFVAYFPISGGYNNEPGFVETEWGADPRLVREGTLSSNGHRIDEDADRMLQMAHVAYADVFPGIWSYELGVRRGPLYGTEDGHQTALGSQLLGELIAQQLEVMRPWQQPPR